MNSITVAGRVGSVKVHQSRNRNGNIVMIIGVSDKYWDGKEKQTQWWNCKIFGKRAASIQKFVQKGTTVTVVGRVQPDDYTREDGTAVPSKQLIVDQIDFINTVRRDEPTRHDPDTEQFDGKDSWDDGDRREDYDF